MGHSEARVGIRKTSSLRTAASTINSGPDIRTHEDGITAANALALCSEYDVVADCSDNPYTRYIVNDACVLAGVPLVSAAAVGTDGQLSVYGHNGGPCYRCALGPSLASWIPPALLHSRASSPCTSSTPLPPLSTHLVMSSANSRSSRPLTSEQSVHRQVCNTQQAPAHLSLFLRCNSNRKSVCCAQRCVKLDHESSQAPSIHLHSARAKDTEVAAAGASIPSAPRQPTARGAPTPACSGPCQE